MSDLRHWIRSPAHWLILRRLLWQLAVAGVLLLACGVVYWWLEPHTPHFSDGLWLAFVTASTLGYGDIVPSTNGSRAFAMFVVLIGLAVLSLVTASVAAMFVGTEERQIERDLMREIASLRAEVRAIADAMHSSPAART